VKNGNKRGEIELGGNTRRNGVVNRTGKENVTEQEVDDLNKCSVYENSCMCHAH